MSTSTAVIVNWSIIHEQIVALHIAGKLNKEIALIVDRTPERVSQVLNSDRAKEIIQRVRLNMRERMREEIETRLVVLAEESVGRLEETVEAEFLLGSKAKEHQDSVAIQVLKGTGFLSKDFSADGETKRPPLNNQQAERLIHALEKANRAEEIAHTYDLAPAEIVEAEVEDEDD